ncbi:LPXTG cell wall anchor domain-containing protein [Enterococcus rotai]|uniref:LPXTG cell wall anchor domain-containing protein n=1 Tax=Enterococcus rotai TaxID=118060 RepID=UPI0032B3B8E1
MKKVVFCLVALSLALPLTSFAEETPSTSETSQIESSSEIVASTQDTEKNDEKKVHSTVSSTVDSSTTETSSTTQNMYDGVNLLSTTLVVFPGEKVTAEMLFQDGGFHGTAYRELKLLEEASTEKLGKNSVKVSFMLYPLEEDQGEKQEVKLNMRYLVAKLSPTFDIQFVSYDSENNQVKGRIVATDGASTSNVAIYGANATDFGSTPTNIKEFYPFTNFGVHSPILTDSEGYFILPYKDNFTFTAFSPESGDYSPICTLKDKAFTGAAVTTDSSTPAKSTDSSSTSAKETEKKKGLFPNTGEKKTVYFSIAGIAIILLAVLFLFIKSKKNKK